MHVIFYVAKIHILWKNAMLDGIESVIKVQISVIFLHKNQALAADFAVIVCVKHRKYLKFLVLWLPDMRKNSQLRDIECFFY